MRSFFGCREVSKGGQLQGAQHKPLKINFDMV